HPMPGGACDRGNEDCRYRGKNAAPAGDAGRAGRPGRFLRRESRAPLPVAGGARRSARPMANSRREIIAIARSEIMTTRTLDEKDKYAVTGSALGAVGS